MSGQALPGAVFCLATGAALGCLFLLFQGMSQLLGLKKLGAALVDVLFCCLCGGFVFLCALAVDSGRLRLYQAALQGRGAWCGEAAFGPLARRGVGRALVEHALAEMGRPVSIEVLAGNAPALALYEGCGFRRTETLTGKMPGNEDFSVTVHVLELP